MRHIARLLLGNGALIFNTGAPYDDQMIFEHADRYARLQGTIGLDLEGVTWTVNAAGGDVPCAACGERSARLRYTRPDLVLCASCARSTRLVPLRARAARKPPRRTDEHARKSRQRRLPDAGL